MALVLLIVFVAFSVGFFTYVVVPVAMDKMVSYNQRKSQQLSNKMDQFLIKSDTQKMKKLYMLIPAIAGIVGYLLFPEELKLAGVIIFVVVGFFIPNIWVKGSIVKRKQKFDNQLVDALMIMSSSFRGGLSLIQAMEAVVEEMPDPIDQEMGSVLSENKMGVSLEEALNHLYDRMPSAALQQMITAILLARETGGNLPTIFMRIVNSIREHKKIQESITTLTLQGKLQGIIMSLLPIAFAVVVYSTNPSFLENMLQSELGRVLLIYAFISECIGAVLIWKISTFKDY